MFTISSKVYTSKIYIYFFFFEKKATAILLIVTDKTVVAPVEIVTLVGDGEGPCWWLPSSRVGALKCSCNWYKCMGVQGEAAGWQRQIKIFLTHKSNQMPIFLHLT